MISSPSKTDVLVWARHSYCVYTGGTYRRDGNITGEGIGMALVKRYRDTSDIGIEITLKVGEGTSVALNLSLVRL